MSEDIRNLPKDKQRALQHADKTAKAKSKVSLARLQADDNKD